MKITIYYKDENQNQKKILNLDFVWNEITESFQETTGKSVWEVSTKIISGINSIISFGGKIQRVVFENDKIAVTIKDKKVDFICTKNISEYILFVLTA